MRFNHLLQRKAHVGILARWRHAEKVTINLQDSPFWGYSILRTRMQIFDLKINVKKNFSEPGTEVLSQSITTDTSPVKSETAQSVSVSVKRKLSSKQLSKNT